jgi:hypothetical protein
MSNQDLNVTDDSVSSDAEESSMNFIEIAVVLLLLAIFLVQILMVSKPRTSLLQPQMMGGYQEMPQDEFDKVQDEFDTKSFEDYSIVKEPEIEIQSTDEANESLLIHEEEEVREQITDSNDSIPFQPEDTLEGQVDENGYEWLEYPAQSGKNYYRIQGESKAWTLWTNSDDSS